MAAINDIQLFNETLTLFDIVHPVNSLYWTTSDEHPSVTFHGLGEWEQIKDTFILAAGDIHANGSTGGAETVTLNATNMPAHSHTTNSQSTTTTGDDSPDHSHGNNYYCEISFTEAGLAYIGAGAGWLVQKTTGTGGASTRHQHSYSHTHGTSNAYGDANGNAVAHNNMPPYLTAYCWKRIS